MWRHYCRNPDGIAKTLRLRCNCNDKPNNQRIRKAKIRKGIKAKIFGKTPTIAMNKGTYGEKTLKLFKTKSHIDKIRHPNNWQVLPNINFDCG